MAGDYVDLSVLPAYLAVVAVICAAPGPDMAYMVGTGVAGGRAAVTRAALGVTLGVTLYAAAVAAGLGPLVQHHSAVLTGVRGFGAVYLAWLAVRTFADSRRPGAHAPIGRQGDAHWFRRGLIVNLTNPKVMLFFIAFLPQFLGGASSPFLQFLMLGVTFQVVGLVGDLAVGWMAALFRDKVLAQPTAMRAMTLVSAGVFAGLAVIVSVEAARSLVNA
jgi:threonine/homoserine/homoserine lactone efflux protein